MGYGKTAHNKRYTTYPLARCEFIDNFLKMMRFR